MLISFANTCKFIDYFAIHFGVKEGAIHYIKAHRPKLIIFSNDHNPYIRAFLLGSIKCNVPTVYIQHASVSNLFPPLSFTYSLLDGKDSLLKYESVGNCSGEIHLLGIPKYDKYISYRKDIKDLNTIGIGYNAFDDIDNINTIVSELNTKFPLKYIIIRSHPSDKRELTLSNLNNVFISNSVKENSFEFINKIDLLICGDSSLHLEAAMLNRPCVYYRFTNTDIFDYYGYLKKRINIYIKNNEELMLYIAQYRFEAPGPYIHTKFYNEAIMSDFEGHSTEKIIDFLNNKLHNHA